MSQESAALGTKNGGDAIIDVLMQYSVEYVFTSPIAALAPLWEAFAKRHAVSPDALPQYVNCRHELLAVSLAIGYYKSTGKLPVVCLPTGLGVLNGSMALRTAKQEGIPMLVISPDTMTFGEEARKDPGPEWPTFLIDEYGPARHAATTTKWSIACRTPHDLYPNLHRAIYFSQQIAKGPVMVEIPFELMMTPYDEVDSPANRMPGLTSDSVVASADHLEQVAQTIAAAKNPIIITEHFGSSRKAIELLDLFSTTLAAPVFEWWMPAYANYDRSSPLHGKGGVEQVLGDADLVIVLCSHGPWHAPKQTLRPGCQVIVIEQAPLRPTSAFWGYETTVCVSGDPILNLEAIQQRLSESALLMENQAVIAERFTKWSEYNESQKKVFEDKVEAEVKMAEDNGSVHASVVFEELARSLPVGSIIVDEMVSQIPSFTHYFFQQPEKQFQHCRGWQGGLGTGIGVALGAKLANPNRMVVCVVGDGAFNYNPIPACFGFSQQCNLPILIVVMNNSGYISQTWNFYKYFPEGAALSNHYLPGASIDPSPKYALLPPAWGGYGECVETKQDLSSAVATALDHVERQLVLLDIRVAP